MNATRGHQLAHIIAVFALVHSWPFARAPACTHYCCVYTGAVM